MAKLYYRYGTVGSAKTLNLLAVAHNYEQQGKRALLIKPALDDRFGKSKIRSRAGLERDTDLLVEPGTEIDRALLEGVDCVLVDEAQFLSDGIVDQLRRITIDPGIPVICYGLRTDFRTELFAGSKRLLEVADRIEEVKTTCAFCNKKAINNLKLKDGAPTLEGPSVDLGAEEKYLPACYRCYLEKIGSA
jgi:thymidine kinase